MKRCIHCCVLLLFVAILSTGCVGSTPSEVFLPGLATLTPSPAADSLPEPSPTAPAQAESGEPAATPAGVGSIAGRVWHDTCGISGGEGDVPAVPSAGCVANGEGFRANGVMEPEEPGIGNVLVSLAQGACPGTGFASTLTTPDGEFAFSAIAAGDYCISADSLAPENAHLLPGSWTLPVGTDKSAAHIALSLAAGDTISNTNFGWDYQYLPEPPITACANKAVMTQDVTFPDNARIAPGQAFDKTWRVRNTGACTWDTSYTLVFAKGELMGGPSSVSLPRTVAPGESVDLTVRMIAPMTPGTYRGNWQLRDGDGTIFGIENSADHTFWVQIISGLLPTVPPPTPVPQGLIGGRVWHDQCDTGSGGQPAPGCVPDGSGGYRADGVMQENERGIAGVAVEIGVGPCPSNGLKATLAAADGSYTFLEMAAGTYCVSITPASPRNSAILQSGNWTYPAPGHNSTTVTIPANGRYLDVDFGWDYQFEPAPGQPTPGVAERIQFAAGTTSATIQTSLTSGSPKEYLLAVMAGQDIWITATDHLSLAARGPDGSPVPVWETPGKWEWRLQAPSTGDIALVMQGSGEIAFTVSIPSLPPSDPGTIPTPERIVFAGGQSSATLSFVLESGMSKAYMLNAAQGQQMRISLTPSVTSFLVLDPNGVSLSPLLSLGNGRWEYALPYSGDYILLLQGIGANTMTVEIPPL